MGGQGEERRGDVKMEELVKVVGPMNGKFTFHKRPDGTIDKCRVICLFRKKEFAYH